MLPRPEMPGRVLVSETTPGTVTARLSGAFDLANADRLDDTLRAALHDQRPAVLALDMTAVEFCDCAVVRILLRVRADGALIGCRVVVAAASPMVAWLLRLLDVEGPFDYPPTGSSRIPRAGSAGWPSG
ncbi:STAS domain-containing protein [Actinoplanes aureus]|uniref:STAS domain-containing protein n=1 Tax=Actinoplanes aureus TaxID=2792083 RepID=A0A931CBC1_9ACTN|nr:STAS domain-containing protein [Actinoplanes aureus]MBG0564246.1 STAS domain-containing protein [Actinoplanes aureus]